jgi:hypothetical protein
VKTLRVWLLLLLAVLLPMRGAMAAAMPCPPATPSHHAVVSHEPCHQGSDAAAEQPGADQTAADTGGCDLCATCALAAPLPSTVVSGVPEPLGLRSAAAPEPGALAPSFLCSGLERPPRKH